MQKRLLFFVYLKLKMMCAEYANITTTTTIIMIIMKIIIITYSNIDKYYIYIL